MKQERMIKININLITNRNHHVKLELKGEIYEVLSNTAKANYN